MPVCVWEREVNRGADTHTESEGGKICVQRKKRTDARTMDPPSSPSYHAHTHRLSRDTRHPMADQTKGQQPELRTCRERQGDRTASVTVSDFIA